MGTQGIASGLQQPTALPMTEPGPCCPLDASVPFAINDTTGTITVSQVLDREQLLSEEVLLEVLVSGHHETPVLLLALHGLTHSSAHTGA